MSAVLDVRDVAVTLGGRRVLHDVSFAIQPGEFTGLIGSNGAGKTTLLRVILGLLRPDDGTVTLRGEPITGSHRSIGYVPQKLHFDADLPVRVCDFVALGVDGQRFGIARRRRAVNDAVARILEEVDATHLRTRKIGSLSGGEQQRILVAHALVSEPDLIVLDEPLANLDPGVSSEVIALLAKVTRERGVALLLSAHEMNPLLGVMDRIVYVANGTAASGPTNEVIRSEVLSALYGHHVDVLRVHGRVLVVTGEGGAGGPEVPSHPPLVVE